MAKASAGLWCKEGMKLKLHRWQQGGKDEVALLFYDLKKKCRSVLSRTLQMPLRFRCQTGKTNFSADFEKEKKNLNLFLDKLFTTTRFHLLISIQM